MNDYLASNAIYASIYSEILPFEPGEPKPKFPHGIGFNVEGRNDHLPVTRGPSPRHADGPGRFTLSSRWSVPVIVPDGRWKALKDIFDHLDVCNMQRDKVFKHTKDMVLQVELYQSEGYQTPLLTLKRIIIDPNNIDERALFDADV